MDRERSKTLNWLILAIRDEMLIPYPAQIVLDWNRKSWFLDHWRF
jgi:hypothetical protein